MHLSLCSTSGARDWHMCQHPSPCPSTATSSLHPALCVPPSSSALGVTPKPTRARSCWGAQGDTTAKAVLRGWGPQQSPGTGGSGLERADTARQGVWDPWVPTGAGRAWQGGLGAATGCRPGAHDLCMVPGAWGLLVPTDLWSAVPPSQPLPAAQNQCGASAGASGWYWCLY